MNKKLMFLCLLVAVMLIYCCAIAYADQNALQCPQGCPLWHVEIWSGGTYDTNDATLWDHIYGYNISDNYIKTAQEPTCTECGKIEYRCGVCGYTDIEEIDPLGHDYEEIERIEPTCYSEGRITSMCSRHTVNESPYGTDTSYNGCTDIKCEILEKTAHSYENDHEIIPANCVDAAIYLEVCSVAQCGNEHYHIYGNPLGHLLGNQQPYNENYLICYCQRNGCDYSELLLIKPDEPDNPDEPNEPNEPDEPDEPDDENCEHDWKIVSKTPSTCRDEGKTEYVCTKCKNAKSETIPVDPNAHKYQDGEGHTPSTCVKKGDQLKTCSVCFYTIEDELPLDPQNHENLSDIMQKYTAESESVLDIIIKYAVRVIEQ